MTRISRSIVGSVSAYFVVQCLIWVMIITPARAVTAPYTWYVPSAAVLHLAIALALLARRADFTLLEAKEPLDRVNVACHLTLFRLSSAITILFLAIAVSRSDVSGAVLVVFASLAFFTDFIDGQVARRMGQLTRIGAYLDSSTDYAVLLVLSISFVIVGITPLWFFVAVVVRFVGFAGVMLFIASRRGILAETTLLGKASVFAVMVTFAFEIARFVGLPSLGNPNVVQGIEIAAAVIIGISVVDKIVFLFRRSAHG